MQTQAKQPRRIRTLLRTMVLTMALLFVFTNTTTAQVTNPQTGAAGLTGTIPADPPAVSPTISFPVDGAAFDDIPVTVTGICQDGLLVKLFKNEVFAGSAQCIGGTYSIEIDLFSGTNTLVARQFDDLDQPSPDSNTPTVDYQDASGLSSVDRVLLTSSFAKRGANPGATLTWPLTLTGGVGPYAISVDWGDGEETLLTQQLAGDFSIEHIYEISGTYKIVVKAQDANGTAAFIQLVGVANGPLVTRIDETDPNAAAGTGESTTVFRVITWPLYVMLFLIVSTFWLGRRYELKKLKRKLAANEPLNY